MHRKPDGKEQKQNTMEISRRAVLLALFQMPVGVQQSVPLLPAILHGGLQRMCLIKRWVSTRGSHWAVCQKRRSYCCVHGLKSPVIRSRRFPIHDAAVFRGAARYPRSAAASAASQGGRRSRVGADNVPVPRGPMPGFASPLFLGKTGLNWRPFAEIAYDGVRDRLVHILMRRPSIAARWGRWLREITVKNPKVMKWLAAVPFVASGGLLALMAVPPAAAAPANPFELPEQCNYFPEPTNVLACFSQNGQISQTAGPGGNPVTYASVTTTSAVYDGATKAGVRIAQSKTTQIRSAPAKNGQPAVFHLRQQIRADNFAAGLLCTFHIQLETVGDHVQNARADINCR